MASIMERKGRFTVRVRQEGFKPVAKTFTRKQDAVAWGRRVEADMEAGRWLEASTTTPTLAAAIEQYKQTAGRRLKGSATYAYWLDQLASSSMGRMALGRIAPRDIAAWRVGMEAAGLKPGTVARKLGLLSGLLSWAQKECHWIDANPARSVAKPKVSDARDRMLTDDELGYLRRAMTAGRVAWLQDAVIVLMRSAMRRGELWGLRPSAVNVALSVAHLSNTKNGSARDVPLCPEARNAIQRLIDAAALRGDTRLIPTAAASGLTLAFRRALGRARRTYGSDCARQGVTPVPGFLGNVRLHDLRHIAVTHWASTGALSTLHLQAISGHKTPRMLSRYTHLSASALAQRMAEIAH